MKKILPLAVALVVGVALGVQARRSPVLPWNHLELVPGQCKTDFHNVRGFADGKDVLVDIDVCFGGVQEDGEVDTKVYVSQRHWKAGSRTRKVGPRKNAKNP